MTVVFMFPGQSSRYPTMFEKLLAWEPANRTLLQEASAYLGRDLEAHYKASNSEMFSCNRDVQIGVFLANHMFLKMLQERYIEADYSLGLSLGEWNHLVHIGALSFEDALLAVEARGRAYDEGPKGSMASMFPVSLEDLEPVLEQARVKGVIEAVNLNSPRQQVISGEDEALEEALRLAEDELYVQGVVIERQVPMHSSLFAPVARRFAQTLETLAFGAVRRPYFPNRLGALVPEPTRETFVELLSTHVAQPVLWRQSIDHLMARHPDAVLVEVGAKAVLYNLLDRRWHRGVKKFCTDSREDTAAHFAGVVDALRALRTPVMESFEAEEALRY